MVKKLFLPIGLLVSIAVACFLPAPGAWLRAHHGIQLFIVTIFLVNGWTVKLSGEHLNLRLALALVVACLLSLVAGPWIGVWVSRAIGGLSGPLEIGIVVMSAVPVTLSSAIVISGVAGGNAVWALIMTMGMNLAGIIMIPVMLKLCLEVGGDTQISAPVLLFKLINLVLLPFVIGHLARRLLRYRTPRLLRYLPSLCVILTVYAAFAASRDDLLAVEFNMYPRILVSVLTIHLILFAAAVLLSRLMKFEAGDEKAFCFVSSQKSLPIAVSVLAALALDSAMVLLPCLIFHFCQLFLDSCIAFQWSRVSARNDA